MHICHCFKDFSLSEGGIERYIRYISEAALREGHKVSVVVSRRKNSPEREIVGGIEELRVSALFKIFKVPIMPGYYRCLSSINPDIVHAHGSMPGVADIAIMYAARNKKPSVFNYQNDGNAESVLGNVFASIYNHSINPFAVSKSNKVTTTSISYAETSPVLKHFLDKVEVVPNGVDHTHFNPDIQEGYIRAKYAIPEGNIIFFAGRFVKYKGIDYLIKAMNYVKDGTLVLAGAGQEENNLKSLVKELNLINIRFTGMIPHEELPQFYKMSDVYVLPSVTRGENFGIAALEAMACGTPIVASDLPGVKVLISDECGIKVRPKDVHGLANAINTLLSDNSLRSKMGIAARENAENYSWDLTAKKILEIYGDLA